LLRRYAPRNDASVTAAAGGRASGRKDVSSPAVL
jgi:hypothetical protein